jgi:hypothetical protein
LLVEGLISIAWHLQIPVRGRSPVLLMGGNGHAPRLQVAHLTLDGPVSFSLTWFSKPSDQSYIVSSGSATQEPLFWRINREWQFPKIKAQTALSDCAANVIPSHGRWHITSPQFATEFGNSDSVISFSKDFLRGLPPASWNIPVPHVQLRCEALPGMPYQTQPFKKTKVPGPEVAPYPPRAELRALPSWA